MINRALFYSLLILTFVGCSSASHTRTKLWMTPNGKVKVLCTIEMIEDIVENIGGDHVDTLTLVQGELDPHTYQLVKGDDEKLSFAQIIFYNGLGLEHGPSLRSYLSGAKKAVALGDQIKQESPDRILHYNGQIDPHIWMDISLWRRTIPTIVKTLSEFDPDHTHIYQKNGENLSRELEQAHEEIYAYMQELPSSKRYLVTSHDAFNYFARAYLATDEERATHTWQQRFAAPEGLAPESQLSVTDIQQIIDHMKEHNIRVLFPESNVSQDSIRKIVDAGNENGLDFHVAQVYLYGDAMGREGSSGDTYIKMLWHNAKTIEKYLHNNH